MIRKHGDGYPISSRLLSAEHDLVRNSRGERREDGCTKARQGAITCRVDRQVGYNVRLKIRYDEPGKSQLDGGRLMKTDLGDKHVLIQG